MRPEKGLKVRIIGVPLDLGASRRGTDMGPSALRIAGLGNALRRMGYTFLWIGTPSMTLTNAFARLVDEIKNPEASSTSEEGAPPPA